MHEILHTDTGKELIEEAPDEITLQDMLRVDLYSPEWCLLF
jgi:hypothetical protein